MRNVVSLIFGSEKDLPHIREVVQLFDSHGWRRMPNDIYNPAVIDGQIAYGIAAGSAHRDLSGTIEYAQRISCNADERGDRLIFVTCIGINDDASGVIASQTGNRVVALPPDSKVYSPYPKGIAVYPFSEDQNRSQDITFASDWIQREFDNPEWDYADRQNWEARTKARGNLDTLRAKLGRDEIQF